jgi:hypothetical protein
MRRVILTLVAAITIAGNAGCCRVSRFMCRGCGSNGPSCENCDHLSWGYTPECKGPMLGAPKCFKDK